jgi:hypothetical protein
MSDSSVSSASASPAAASAPASDTKSSAPIVDPNSKPVSGAGEPVPAKTEPKTYTVKVDGREVKVTEDELLRGYALNSTGQKRMKEAAEVKKSAEAEKAQFGKFIQAAKQGDYAALANAGLTEDEIEGLSIKFLSAKQQSLLEQERVRAMDPKERAIMEREQALAKREAELKAHDDEKRTGSVNQVKQQFTNQVVKTLEGFPEEYRKSEFLANRVVDAWMEVYEHADELEAQGFTIADVTPEAIAAAVQKEVRGLYKLMVGKAKDEELEEYVPPEIREKLMQIAKTKAEAGAHPSLTGQPIVRDTEKKDEAPKNRVTSAQLMRRAYGHRPA